MDLTTHTSLSPIRRGFAPDFVNCKKGCTRLAAASDKVYQFHAHGRWFSPCTPASSTTKTDRHDIAEILLKVDNIRNMMRFEDPPNYIVVHIRGNDLGNISLGYLHYQLVHFMSWLSNQLPETTLIWSQILPRLKWRNFENTVIMDKCRRRLNSFIGAYMIRHGGCFFGTQILRLLMNSFPLMMFI